MCGMNDADNSIIASARDTSLELGNSATRIVDVRRAEEYAAGHLVSAVNIPLAELLADDSTTFVAKLARRAGIGDDTRVIVYDDTFGALASRLVWSLEHIGHKHVSLLDATYSQWVSQELETSKDEFEFSAKEHSVKTNPDIIATTQYLDDAKSRDGITLIDNRERLNYLENHIPGAQNIPYRTLGNEQHVLRPRDDLRRLLENRQIRPTDEIITYCGSVGTLSGLAYCALRSVGMPNVRLYVRSFKEWKSLEKPLETQPDANYWDLSAE